jgi:LPXTG-motif cell wall-anchored protein
MNRVMKRISEIALVFLPIQAIGGFMGMNCTVPFQTGEDQTSTAFFWAIIGGCLFVGIFLFFLRRRILATRNSAEIV